MYTYIPTLNLQHFASGDVVNATIGFVNANTGEVSPFTPQHDLSPQNKTFYDTALLENARTKHYFSQFGMKQTLPANHGQSIEFRRFNTLPKSTKPLQEGVTPTGRKMGQTVLTKAIHQYGDYVQMTDKIDMHSIDNVVLAATEELGAAAGDTQDALTRNELLTGTNVMYCDVVDEDGKVTATPTHRYELVAGAHLTPKMINRAVTILKKANAPTINGKYYCLIHPSVAEDLRESNGWVESHKYAAPEEIFNGEIGELHGMRFIETTTVRTFVPATLNTAEQRYLTVTAYSGSASDTAATAGTVSPYRITVTEAVTEELVGRLVNLEASGKLVDQYEIVGVNVGSKYLYLDEQPTVNPAQGNMLMPGEGGAELSTSDGPVAVYACMAFGKDAYAVIDPAGGAMETFVKPLGSAGSADPLNQRSTVGYKFETAAIILYQERMLRIECTSSYSGIEEDNA